MLMKPLIRRHHDAPPLPVDAPPFFTGRPQDRIALAAKNDHMRAWAMLMSFLVRADGELRDMGAHGVLCQIELHIRAALAALIVGGELHIVRVWHEIGGQEKPPG